LNNNLNLVKPNQLISSLGDLVDFSGWLIRFEWFVDYLGFNGRLNGLV